MTNRSNTDRVCKQICSIFLVMSFIIFSSDFYVKAEDCIYKKTISFSKSDFGYYTPESGLYELYSKLPSDYPDINLPCIPFISCDIAVPRNFSYVSVRYTTQTSPYLSNIKLTNSPISQPTDEIKNNHISYSANYSTGKYPDNNCRYITTTHWGDMNVLHFQISPFIYDSSTNILTFIDKMDINISLADNQTLQKSASHGRIINPQILKSFITNPEDIKELNTGNRIIRKFEDDIKYVIITNSKLKNSFDSLILWKRIKGIPASVITTEEISNQYDGNTLQLKIKQCLYDLWQNRGLKYAMLGGDDTIIPVLNCFGREKDGNGNTDIWNKDIPCDLFYACFDGTFDWNGDKDDYYGEVEDSVSFIPYIFLTRLPVRSEQDVRSYTNKLINYEKNPKINNNILMCGVKLREILNNDGLRSDAECKGENLYINFIQPYWDGIRYRFYDTFTDFEGCDEYDLVSENLLEKISKGYTYLDMITHGWMTSWSMESGLGYNATNGTQQSNDSYTFITTMACHTNAFDVNSDPCLSESLIRNGESGIIGFLGCSRSGWFTRGATLGPSLNYESYFYKNLFSRDSSISTFGELVASAKIAMISKCYYNSCNRWIQFGLNPVGDPEMPLYKTTPKEFSNSNISISSGILSINTGEQDSKICIMSIDDHGDSYYKIIENSQTVSLTNFPSCNICMTKPGFIPKEYRVIFIQNEILTDDQNISADIIELGSNVTNHKQQGRVIFRSGKYCLKAPFILIEPETYIENNVELILDN